MIDRVIILVIKAFPNDKKDIFIEMLSCVKYLIEKKKYNKENEIDNKCKLIEVLKVILCILI